MLLIWKWMGLFLRKKYLSVLNWIVVLTLPVLLRLLLRNSEPWLFYEVSFSRGCSVSLQFYHIVLHGILLSCLGWCSVLVDVHLNWFNWFHFLILEGDALVILTDCMVFLSPFLDVTRMSMSTVPFLALWNFLPIKCFPLTYDLNGFKSRINRHLLIVDSF